MRKRWMNNTVPRSTGSRATLDIWRVVFREATSAIPLQTSQFKQKANSLELGAILDQSVVARGVDVPNTHTGTTGLKVFLKRG